jgi:hypothetical protein
LPETEGSAMILRRIADAIRTQNWFTVIIEILIVVIGIFLGLQVDGWNEARKDKVDSLEFLQRIHEEILVIEHSSARVRLRRLNLIGPLEETAKVLFADGTSLQLGDKHCTALATSHYYHISVPEMPSLEELMSVGRVSIIDDVGLRTALISMRQSASALQWNIENVAPIVHDLPIAHPALITSRPYFDEQLGEMQARYICDFQAMLGERSFLNKVSENIDGYDVYLRDGLIPWNEQLSKAHNLIDVYMKIEHNEVQK